MRASQLAAVVGAVMLVGVTAGSALAQVPGGSYLESCTNVHGFGDRLIADCRRADGSWRRAVLPDVGSCAGDISNQNGHLRCDRGGPPYGGYGYQPYAPPARAVVGGALGTATGAVTGTANALAPPPACPYGYRYYNGACYR